MQQKQSMDSNQSQKIFFQNLNQKMISKIHKQVKKQNSISGAWSDEENLIYALFIENNPYQFETPDKRRRYKVFQRMAMHLPNRTAIQCRSHNQKIVKLAGDILNVPNYIKQKISAFYKKRGLASKITQEEQYSTSDLQQYQKTKLKKNLIQQLDNSKQQLMQGFFKLPLKLCIQIKSQNIEDY